MGPPAAPTGTHFCRLQPCCNLCHTPHPLVGDGCQRALLQARPRHRRQLLGSCPCAPLLLPLHRCRQHVEARGCGILLVYCRCTSLGCLLAFSTRLQHMEWKAKQRVGMRSRRRASVELAAAGAAVGTTSRDTNPPSAPAWHHPTSGVWRASPVPHCRPPCPPAGCDEGAVH